MMMTLIERKKRGKIEFSLTPLIEELVLPLILYQLTGQSSDYPILTYFISGTRSRACHRRTIKRISCRPPFFQSSSPTDNDCHFFAWSRWCWSRFALQHSSSDIFTPHFPQPFDPQTSKGYQLFNSHHKLVSTRFTRPACKKHKLRRYSG